MRLLLVRHGQTPANVLGELDTDVPGPGLTDLGRRQAAALPSALADEAIGTVVVTDLVRTHETAAPLVAALGLEPLQIGELREISAGDLERRSDPEAVQAYLSAVVGWAEGDLDRQVPGGESGHEFFARYDAGIATAVAAAQAAGHGTLAVVSHGAAIRCWAAARSTGRDEGFLRTHQLENTGVVVVEGEPGDGWRLVDWHGDAAGGAQLGDGGRPDPTGEGVPDGR